MLIAHLTSRHSRVSSFFDGDRSSPWFLVAFGMIGSGISAVSLVSIPGNVGNDHLHYFQFILGTIAGYLFIAFILVPLFYKLRLVSIYTYLRIRFGETSHKTGALFFVVSQSFGAALRLLLSVRILQYAFFDALKIPYYLTILLVLLMIWLYTNKSGVKTIVWTDALQSFFMITVIVLSIFTIMRSLDISVGGLFEKIRNSPHARIFNWDPKSGSHFLKQFISGLLITVALVGLDQSMMQKTLTISSQHGARKNVLTFSFFIAFAQTLFLLLGILLYLYAAEKGVVLEQENGVYVNTDGLYPFLTMNYFGSIGSVAFFIGVIASTFATVDSCIAALTTSISYDFLAFERQDPARKRKIKDRVLLAVNAAIFIIVLAFWKSQGAIIGTIFKIAGYTYGPLLGLYLFGLFTSLQVKERLVPAACVAAALVTVAIDWIFKSVYDFDTGFVNILVNALLTVIFLFLIKKNTDGKF
jgi:Na+/proline symporter